eukprot:217452_1
MNEHNTHWICNNCSFRNNSIIEEIDCLFCTNRWQCNTCELYNHNKHRACILCQNERQSKPHGMYICPETASSYLDIQKIFNINVNSIGRAGGDSVDGFITMGKDAKAELKVMEISVNEVLINGFYEHSNLFHSFLPIVIQDMIISYILSTQCDRDEEFEEQEYDTSSSLYGLSSAALTDD